MTGNEAINRVDLDSLAVVRYPDPRLRHACAKIDDPSAPSVRTLVERMGELMFAAKGVGLAAPQVGVNARLFIASPTFEESDFQVFINPVLSDPAGKMIDEEGCLSFPGIYCKVTRYSGVTVEALGIDGQDFTVRAEDFPARVYQHEADHLEGRLLLDRMGTVARLANRKALKMLEEEFTG